MSEPVKIKDMARRMIELSGRTMREQGAGTSDIKSKVTGLRLGEKFYEELLISDNPKVTAHERITRAREDFVAWPLLALLLV